MAPWMGKTACCSGGGRVGFRHCWRRNGRSPKTACFDIESSGESTPSPTSHHSATPQAHALTRADTALELVECHGNVKLNPDVEGWCLWSLPGALSASFIVEGKRITGCREHAVVTR